MDIKYYQGMRKIDRLSMGFKHRKNNLLEHQYFVAMLFQHFAKLEKIEYGLEELNIVLHHDALEVVTTDLSWEVKCFSKNTKVAWEIIESEFISKHPQLGEFSDKNIKEKLNFTQHALFKTCDLLDLFIFVEEEIKLGNKDPFMLKVRDNCLKLFSEMTVKFNSIFEFIKVNYG